MCSNSVNKYMDRSFYISVRVEHYGVKGTSSWLGRLAPPLAEGSEGGPAPFFLISYITTMGRYLVRGRPGA